MHYFNECCRIVDSILRGGAYSNIKLADKPDINTKDRALIYRIVQGVLQNNLLLEYQISKHCNKRPKPAVATIIKVALYCIFYMNIPDYAAVSNALKYAQKSGKKTLKPLINAVLTNSRKAGILYPDVTEGDYNIVKYSINPSLHSIIYQTYGNDTQSILAAYNQEYPLRHIRAADNDGNIDTLNNKLAENDIEFERTQTGAYVNLSQLYNSSIAPTDYAVMSYGSTLIANSVIATSQQNSVTIEKILDACAAPGGKSVYLAQKLPNSSVTACDLHSHRVELIENYANNYGVPNIRTMQINNAEYYANFKDSFCVVLCDVPCSGLGTAHRKPEIKLMRTEQDVLALADTAYNILSNCSRYVRSGGIIFYSTCTITQQENDGVVDKFLQHHSDFRQIKLFGLPEDVQCGYNLRMVNGINASEGYFMSAFIKD